MTKMWIHTLLLQKSHQHIIWLVKFSNSPPSSYSSLKGRVPKKGSAPGESPAMGEGKTGFDLGKGKRFKYDREVSTALLTTAEAKSYATVFECEGKRFKVMLHNMEDTEVVPNSNNTYYDITLLWALIVENKI